MRICFVFARTAELRFLSHLDMIRMFLRALRRAKIPVAYSQGFNPRPRLSLALPLPVGVTGERECGELFLRENISPEMFRESLNGQLPPGVKLLEAREMAAGAPAMMSVINAARYTARPEEAALLPPFASWSGAIEKLLSREIIPAVRMKKGGQQKTVNVRPFILELAAAGSAASPALEMLLQAGGAGSVSPFVILEELFPASEEAGEEKHLWRVHRCALYIDRQGQSLCC